MALTVPVAEIVERSNNPLLGKAESWDRVLLGDIAAIQNGFAFKSSQFSKDAGMPLIRIRDVGKDTTDTRYVGEYDLAYVVNPGDLLVGMDGDFNCARWHGDPGLLNQRVCRITLTSDIYHPKLLDYALPGYLKAINEMTSSVTVKHLSSKSIAEIPLPLPPTEQQERVVAEIEKQFSRLDEAVANLKRVKANLKRYKAAVLKAAVEGKLTEEWRKAHPDVEPASKLLDRILVERRAKWEEAGLAKMEAKGKVPKSDMWKAKYKEPAAPDTIGLPDLPEGWVYAAIDQLLPPVRDAMKTGPFGSLLKKNEHKDVGVPVLGIENIEAMRFVPGSKIHVSPEKAEELFGYAAAAGDVLISRSGTVGEVCVVPKDIGEARISTNLMKVSLAKDGMLPEFFVMLFNGSPFVLDQVSELCKGSTRDFLNQDILRQIKFTCPPVREQARIISEIERRFSLVSSIEDQTHGNLLRVGRLRQAVLHKAFAGRLCVDAGDTPRLIA